MHKPQHPDTESLDMLRAGLLDDRPQEKAALEQHLAECGSCRASIDMWQQLDPDALGPEMQADNLGRDLQTARMQAMAAANSTHRRAYVRYAAAAAVVLAVSIGLWTSQPGIDTTAVMTAETTRQVPDIYEDLDFYLWLATQDDNDSTDNST